MAVMGAEALEKFEAVVLRPKDTTFVEIKELSSEVVDTLGWICDFCTFRNNPTRPGCEVCGSPPPLSFQPPSLPQIEERRLRPLMDGTIKDLPSEVVDTLGWICCSCTFRNNPTRPGCEVCSSAPPLYFRPPLQQIKERMRRLRRRDGTSAAGQQNQQEMTSVDDDDEDDDEEDMCISCYDDGVGSLIHLRNCGHKLCIGCLTARFKAGEMKCAMCPASLDEIDLQNVKDVPKETVENHGWVCPLCTFINNPTRPGCQICSADKPSGDLQFMESESKRQEEELKKMEDVMNMKMVKPDKAFECPVCVCDLEPEEGIRLRNCLHDVCMDCIIGTTMNDETGDIRCPICGGQVDDRDIRNVVPPAVWEKRNDMIIKLGEASIPNSFHCLTTDCPNFVEIVDDINEFPCGLCNKKSCITCKAQHSEETCEQYQKRLKVEAMNNENERCTLEMFEYMIRNGDAMRCPKCQIVLQKKEGSDWLLCTGCRTELCWATKGYRWGPAGKGDTTGGCGCRINGKPCVPECRNCH